MRESDGERYLALVSGLHIPTHMPTIIHSKYLLVMVDTFSVWVKAFPPTNKRDQMVSDVLLLRYHSSIWNPTLLSVRQWS